MLTHNEYDFINGLKMVLSKFKKEFHILMLGLLCIRGNPDFNSPVKNPITSVHKKTILLSPGTANL